MTITLLKIADFRNLTSLELKPCVLGLNLIYGNNGSGKTSLLEAIHYLGSGKSFKTATATRLIKHTSPKFSLFAQINRGEMCEIPVGVEREGNGTSRFRIASQIGSSVAALAALLPIRIINTQSHQLFEAGPSFRRQYIDWGLFYESEHFLECWRQYERALKQRNIILREKRSQGELLAWTEELIKHGLMLDELRKAYIQRLSPEVTLMVENLLDLSGITLAYSAGWHVDSNFAAVLANRYSEDYALGYTQFGPHRADLEITVDGLAVKHFLSRGQQKLLICAMILAQGMLLAKQMNKQLIYLIDDLPSELDAQGRQRLISLLSKQQAQVFITAIESKTIYDVMNERIEMPMKVFHVEHGSVTEQRME